METLEPKCYGESYAPQEEVVDFFNTTVQLVRFAPAFARFLSSLSLFASLAKLFR
jgi:hypothetical protein